MPVERVPSAYTSPPWWYDVRGVFILTFAYRSTIPHQLRFFGSNVGRRHLEVACGTGSLLHLVLRWRWTKGMPATDVVAMDYADVMLRGAKRRLRRWVRLDVYRADAAALPHPEGTFDTVNIANAIHCLRDVRGALNEIFRVLKPGGTMAANVLLHPGGAWPLRPIAQRIDNWGMRKGLLHRPYTQSEMRGQVSAAGFLLHTESCTGNVYDVLAIKPGS